MNLDFLGADNAPAALGLDRSKKRFGAVTGPIFTGSNKISYLGSRDINSSAQVSAAA
jgi:hypothetical protein